MSSGIKGLLLNCLELATEYEVNVINNMYINKILKLLINISFN